MDILRFLVETIEDSEFFMDEIDREQAELPGCRFPYKQYFTALGRKEVAKAILKDREIASANKEPFAYSNNRLCIFKLEESDQMVAKFFKNDSQPSSQNSHRTLVKQLEKLAEKNDNYIDYEVRLCCFYTVLSGNRFPPTLVIYGESSDYPHNENAKMVLDKFIKMFKEDTGYAVIDLISPTL